MPFNLGFGELLVVMVVALLVFGGRLPQMGKSLGQGLRQFKKGLSDTPDDDDASEEDRPSGNGTRAEEDEGGGAAGLLEAPEEAMTTEPDAEATPRSPAP